MYCFGIVSSKLDLKPEISFYYITMLGQFSQLSFSLKLMNVPNKLVIHYSGLERKGLARIKALALVSSFVSYEEN
jgi:hypothetical protein